MSDMASEVQLTILSAGVDQWNSWRLTHSNIRPALHGVSFREVALPGIDLQGADLREADLTGADLTGANLHRASLQGAVIRGANLQRAIVQDTDLNDTDLHRADLTEANLFKADLIGANLSKAQLIRANLSRADLTGARLDGANLTRARLDGATLVGTSFVNATLDGCNVYGVSAWDLHMERAIQTNLCITPHNLSTHITVDNLQVAQFLYLMLGNQEIRDVIDTLTSRVVLLLGRFSQSCKEVLEALRDGLRNCGYVPVVFDFTGPESRDTTETVSLLARMARFVIADLTDPGSIPYELAKIVPDVHVPVQPLLLQGAATFSMAADLWNAPEMLPVVRYTTADELCSILPKRIISPVEMKVLEIQCMRATALLRSGL